MKFGMCVVVSSVSNGGWIGRVRDSGVRGSPELLLLREGPHQGSGSTGPATKAARPRKVRMRIFAQKLLKNVRKATAEDHLV